MWIEEGVIHDNLAKALSGFMTLSDEPLKYDVNVVWWHVTNINNEYDIQLFKLKIFWNLRIRHNSAENSENLFTCYWTWNSNFVFVKGFGSVLSVHQLNCKAYAWRWKFGVFSAKYLPFHPRDAFTAVRTRPVVQLQPLVQISGNGENIQTEHSKHSITNFALWTTMQLE